MEKRIVFTIEIVVPMTAYQTHIEQAIEKMREEAELEFGEPKIIDMRVDES